MPTIGGEHTETIGISGSGRTWTFKSNFSVHDPAFSGIQEYEGAKNNTIIMHGVAEAEAGRAAINLQGKNTRLEISEDGRLRGDGYGIISYGDGVEIINAGLVKGSAVYGAAYIYGDNAEFRNSGTVLQPLRMIGENALVVNEKGGLFSADGDISAVFFGNEASGGKFVNHGKVEIATVSDATFTIVAFDGDDKLINDGKIIGNVLMGDGNDLIDNRGGKVTGDLRGSGGDDVLITDKASDKLIELSGASRDLVKSTVTYVLNENVELLTLIGKKDIDARGNADSNDLRGNSGNNVLKGDFGQDLLDGKAGNDVLKGGYDGDLFVFKTGYDKDTIDVFEQGQDQIDVLGWKAIDDFGDIKSHAKNHGDDVWITAGDDVLVIKYMQKADLEAGDFGF